MRLYLMRHGETPWNQEGRIQGSVDIELNENGIMLAKETLDGMKREGMKVDYIFSSPYKRARKTAEILSEGKITTEVDERIREMNFGIYEGIPLKEISTKKEYQNMHYFFVDPERFVPENGVESYEEAYERIDAFYQDKILKKVEEDQDVLIVCHGAIIRSFIAYLCQKPIKDLWDLKQPNCALNIFEITKQSRQVVSLSKIVYDPKKIPNRKYT